MWVIERKKVCAVRGENVITEWRYVGRIKAESFEQAQENARARYDRDPESVRVIGIAAGEE